MENNDDLEVIVKLVIIGESFVGKTNILLRFVNNCFKDDEKPTVGMDFMSRDVVLDGQKVKAQFWDTAGQEKYRAIARSYFKIADGVLLVYDVTRRKTFSKVNFWVEDIRQNCSKTVKIMLIGNKIDLVEERTVSTEEGKELANIHNLFFYETSALSN